MYGLNLFGSNTSGLNVVVFSVLIGILLSCNLDDGSKKMAGSAFVLIGVTLFTMSYGCKKVDVCRPAGIDGCGIPQAYYPEGYYQ